MERWTDRFVGDRMAVDRAFEERVAASEFTSQEWGTVMTAVEFDIERPEDPAEARVVADASRVDQVMPALEEVREAMGPPGARGGGGSAGAGGGRGGGGGGGLLDSLKRALGLGEDRSDQRAEAATALADEYAARFQEHLEAQGKWEDACRVAAAHADESTAGTGDAAAAGADSGAGEAAGSVGAGAEADPAETEAAETEAAETDAAEPEQAEPSEADADGTATDGTDDGQPSPE